MDITLLLLMTAAALFGSFLYTLLGVMPGTDETAVLAPVTLAVSLSGVPPEVVVSFFIAAIISKMITGNIPVGVAGIPSGVMSAPMIPSAMVLKEEGKTNKAIKKMSAASVIGTLLAIPISFFFARLLVPFSEIISTHSTLVFMIGTVFLALISKKKILSLIMIFPLSLLIQGLNHLYWGLDVLPDGENVFISFFLAITIGPLMINLMELIVGGSTSEKYYRNHFSKTTLTRSKKPTNTLNPLKILSKKETTNSIWATILGCVTFFMSPVGMMIFIGEAFSSRVESKEKKATMTVTVMNALNNATYIAGTLIPLLAIGIPLSPVAIGPANAMFNAPPVYTIDNNIYHQLSTIDFILPVLIGTIIAIGITYFLTVKYANEITIFVFKNVSHEALLGLFLGLAIILAYMDAGLINIFGMVLLSIFSGLLNRWGVNYGIQFMTLYASTGFINLLI